MSSNAELVSRVVGATFASLRRTATIAAFIVLLFAIALLVAGADVPYAFAAMFSQAFGDAYRLATVVTLTIPLTLAAVGVGIAFRAGIFNLGGQGQIAAGALTGAVVGSTAGIPGPFHVAITLLGGAIVGGLLALLFSVLRQVWNVDEVVSTLLGNYVVLLAVALLVNYVFADPSRGDGATHPVEQDARLPVLFAGTQLTWALAIVIALVGISQYVLMRAKIGADWKLLGVSPSVARGSGLRVVVLAVAAFVVSGALSGLTGALMISATQGRFVVGLGGGLAFNAVLVAMIANYKPIAIAGWAFVFSVLSIGADGIEQQTGLPSELIQVVTAVVVLGVAVREGLLESLRGRAARLFQRGHKPTAPTESEALKS